jgi:hypothetical protein
VQDLRTVSLSGQLDANAFNRRYSFLDEIQEREIETLKHRIGMWKTLGKKGQKEQKKAVHYNGGGAA